MTEYSSTISLFKNFIIIKVLGTILFDNLLFHCQAVKFYYHHQTSISSTKIQAG